MPAEADVDAYANIGEILLTTCKKYADHPAFTCMGKTLNYSDLERLSAQFGAWLQNNAGLTREDRVAIMMPNVLQYPVAIFGVLRAGFVVVNFNPLYTPREVEHQLNDSGATVLVVLENFAKTVQDVLPNTKVRKVITTQLGDLLGFPKSLIVNWVVKHQKKMVPAWNIPGTISFNAVLSEGAAHKFTEARPGHQDLAFLQYTGGRPEFPRERCSRMATSWPTCSR